MDAIAKVSFAVDCLAATSDPVYTARHVFIRTRGCGGIGRRAGLRIQFLYRSAGSTPVIPSEEAGSKEPGVRTWLAARPSPCPASCELVAQLVEQRTFNGIC